MILDCKLPAHWASVMTFRDLFVNHLDIFGVPRRSFFEMLAHFTKDENQTERLREFASPQGQVRYRTDSMVKRLTRLYVSRMTCTTIANVPDAPLPRSCLILRPQTSHWIISWMCSPSYDQGHFPLHPVSR